MLEILKENERENIKESKMEGNMNESKNSINIEECLNVQIVLVKYDSLRFSKINQI